MSASSPRKATAKKAAPRRTAREREEGALAAFDGFRTRAAQFGVKAGDGEGFNPRTYVVSAAQLDDGIKQDAVFRQPMSLQDRTRQMRYMSALKRGDAEVIPDVLVGLSDPYTFERIMRYLDKHAESPADADSMLFGFAITVVENLSGAGAVDVPGGSTGS